MQEFSKTYEQQYAVALFNSVRFEIEGGGGPQSQLLHRKASLLLLAWKEKVGPAMLGKTATQLQLSAAEQ